MSNWYSIIALSVHLLVLIISDIHSRCLAVAVGACPTSVPDYGPDHVVADHRPDGARRRSESLDGRGCRIWYRCRCCGLPSKYSVSVSGHSLHNAVADHRPDGARRGLSHWTDVIAGLV